MRCTASYCRCYPIVISFLVQIFFVSQCLLINLTYSVNILSYFTELKMRNIVFLGALALVSATDDQSCYAHISVSFFPGIFPNTVYFLLRNYRRNATCPGAMTGPPGPAALCTAASRGTPTTFTGSLWTTSPTA